MRVAILSTTSRRAASLKVDFQNDGLACQCLYKDLHASTEAENEMEGLLFLNVIIRESSAIF